MSEFLSFSKSSTGLRYEGHDNFYDTIRTYCDECLFSPAIWDEFGEYVGFDDSPNAVWKDSSGNEVITNDELFSDTGYATIPVGGGRERTFYTINWKQENVSKEEWRLVAEYDYKHFKSIMKDVLDSDTYQEITDEELDDKREMELFLEQF